MWGMWGEIWGHVMALESTSSCITSRPFGASGDEIVTCNMRVVGSDMWGQMWVT